LSSLETLAGQAAISIDNTQLFDNIQRVNMELAIAYEATIEGWSRALELRRQGNTKGYTQRVTELTMTHGAGGHWHPGGTNFNTSAAARSSTILARWASPISILLKKGKLTIEQSEQNHAHAPRACLSMLYNPSTHLRPVAGYSLLPSRKMGRFRLPARTERRADSRLPHVIFAIADVVGCADHVHASLPQGLVEKEGACPISRIKAAKHFDPYVVEVFLRIDGQFLTIFDHSQKKLDNMEHKF
jgi:hypothetical protein